MTSGRLTLYRTEYDDLAFKYCLLGATNDKLAQFFDVCPATIDKWIAAHESFRDHIKRGRAEADAEVAKALYHRAKGYTHADVHISNCKGEIVQTEVQKHYPPDTAAAFIWLKNRAGWRDRKEITGAEGKDLIPELDDREAARRIAFALALAGQKPTDDKPE